MSAGPLGKLYEQGECIVREGEIGDRMYVIQEGEVEVVLHGSGSEVLLSVLGEGDVFGEMALFTKRPRSATVRSRGQTRVLSVDQKTFLQRTHEDPSLAFRIVQKMAERIESLNKDLLLQLQRDGKTRESHAFLDTAVMPR
ncbi:MAG: cyclic nucleotide-binding domain-containing protein [Planctomycetota bacterium]